ncbi:hypothetical protein PM082_014779 [Marasmius tenuissimus]|nr:hypothetical protein PM082_021976 [Marasmius tenuissimus]KAJ8089523.1 hypothetical protein PM082_014779 [Marasmius tenuissimus]
MTEGAMRKAHAPMSHHLKPSDGGGGMKQRWKLGDQLKRLRDPITLKAGVSELVRVSVGFENIVVAAAVDHRAWSMAMHRVYKNV